MWVWIAVGVLALLVGTTGFLSVISIKITYFTGKSLTQAVEIMNELLESYNAHIKHYQSMVTNYNDLVNYTKDREDAVNEAFENVVGCLKDLDTRLIDGSLTEETLKRALDVIDDEQARLELATMKKTEGLN